MSAIEIVVGFKKKKKNYLDHHVTDVKPAWRLKVQYGPNFCYNGNSFFFFCLFFFLQ